MTPSFIDLLKGHTHKSKPIIWFDVTLDLTFKEFEEHVYKAPLLLLPHPSKPFQVETDASDYAISVLLYQQGKPVTFENKKLDPT